eukprot:scaffold316525_cov26-Tisochrysis_lutea.AAC.2
MSPRCLISDFVFCQSDSTATPRDIKAVDLNAIAIGQTDEERGDCAEAPRRDGAPCWEATWGLKAPARKGTCS